MNQEGQNEELLRKYLLGELNEADEQSFEEQLLADDELSDLLLAEEDELIDDYLSGDLSAGEQARFDDHFLVTPERRRKLSFGDALRSYTPEPDPVADPNPTPNSNSASDPKPAVKPRPISDRKPVLQPWWRGVFSTPYIRLAAATVIVLAVGLGSWRAYLLFQRPQMSSGMVALREAYPDQRPTESRITEWNYAPPPPLTRGPGGDKFDYVALDRAKALIQMEANEHPSAQSYHDLGRLYLAEHEFDKAIDQFEKALKLDEKNAQLHSDLGAALLEKGRLEAATDNSGRRLDQFAASLEHLNRALERDGSRVEAIFNRALVHQEMSLPDQAEEDWRVYLEKDTSSPWANEARQNLRLLEERKTKTSKSQQDIFDDFLDASRSRNDERAWQLVGESRDALSGKLISERLVDAYLEASKRGDSDASYKTYQSMSYLGALEARRASDMYTSNVIRIYKSASAARRERLAQARGLMREAYEFSAQSKPLEAIDVCGKAKQMFKQLADEPEALRAEQWNGYSHLEAADTGCGISILEGLIPSFEARGYQWLLMRTYFLLSRGEYDRSEYSKSIDYDNRALALADRIGDQVGRFNALSMLTEQYRYIGNYDAALSCAQRSMSMVESCPLNPIQLERHYGIMAMAFGSFGHYAAAVDFQKETLRGAQAASRFQHIAAAYAHIGLMYGKLGNYEEALKNAGLAYETASALADEQMRKKMMGYSCLLAGHLHREAGDTSAAIKSYDTCIDLFTDLDFHYYVYEAHKNRLNCYVISGDDVLAARELELTLNLAEKYRSKILEGDNRNSFFDLEQSVYDLAIDFEHTRRDDAQKAFEYSEASRSRSLLDLMSTRTHLSEANGRVDFAFEKVAQPLPLAEIRKRMPERVLIVQYAVLDNKLLIWAFSKNESLTTMAVISREKLTDAVTAYVKLISSENLGNPDETKQRATDLFEILIRPVEKLLQGSQTLCVIPDKVLNYLPFSALVSPDTGNFLLADYPVVVAPSSSLFIACYETAKTKEAGRSERLLSVGNPRFARRDYPFLRDLPSAGEEARKVAAEYPAGLISVLLGDAATEERVISEMPGADVIHFAVHAVVDEKSPLRTKLLLTGEAQRPGAPTWNNGELEAHEVYGLKLDRTRVVVLSACQTGVGRYYDGEGMINMARPFIVAGVPLVIASLWPVDSDSTEELMVRFHKYRRVEGSTTNALRRAQLEMLLSPELRFRHPYNWAGFVAFGGTTTF